MLRTNKYRCLGTTLQQRFPAQLVSNAGRYGKETTTANAIYRTYGYIGVLFHFISLFGNTIFKYIVCV